MGNSQALCVNKEKLQESEMLVPSKRSNISNGEKKVEAKKEEFEKKGIPIPNNRLNSYIEGKTMQESRINKISPRLTNDLCISYGSRKEFENQTIHKEQIRQFSYQMILRNKELKMIGGILISNLLIRNLYLSLSSCETVTDEGVKNLQRGLKSLRLLKHFYIKFWRTRVTNKGVKYLKEGLECIHALESININFDALVITDKTLRYMREVLESNKLLRRVKFSLSWCYEISDVGITHLVKGLQNLPLLTVVDLNFRMCKKITNRGVRLLRDSLKSHHLLRSISLNFELCDFTRDQDVINLEKDLWSLPLLKKLYVGLPNYSEILLKFIDYVINSENILLLLNKYS